MVQPGFSENNEAFLRMPPKKVKVDLLNKILTSGNGTSIGYLPLESEGYPGIGMRISKGRFVDQWEVKQIANKKDYVSKYFELAFNKPEKLRILISEVLSSGIKELAENGDIIETPNLFGNALVNRKTGEVLYFLYPPGSSVDVKLNIVKKMLTEQANKLKTEDDWEYASVVTNYDGLDDKTKYQSASDYFDPNSTTKDYIYGLDALQSSSHMVSILKKKGLACVDPGSNPPLYNAIAKKCVVVDIGSFGCADIQTQQMARNFITSLSDESGVTDSNITRVIYNNEHIFVNLLDSNKPWEEMMRLDEIRGRIRYISEVPWIGMNNLQNIKDHWEKFKRLTFNPSEGEVRLAMSKSLAPLGGSFGIDVLMEFLEDLSIEIGNNLDEMIKSAGSNLSLVNSSRQFGQKALREMSETHQKIKELFQQPNLHIL